MTYQPTRPRRQMSVLVPPRGSPDLLWTPLETKFRFDDPSMSYLDLTSRDKVDPQPPSDTNLRYLSEVNEPLPLRHKVDLQGIPSLLFFSLSGGVSDLS